MLRLENINQNITNTRARLHRSFISPQYIQNIKIIEFKFSAVYSSAPNFPHCFRNMCDFISLYISKYFLWIVDIFPFSFSIFKSILFGLWGKFVHTTIRSNQNSYEEDLAKKTLPCFYFGIFEYFREFSSLPYNCCCFFGSWVESKEISLLIAMFVFVSRKANFHHISITWYFKRDTCSNVWLKNGYFLLLKQKKFQYSKFYLIKFKSLYLQFYDDNSVAIVENILKSILT